MIVRVVKSLLNQADEVIVLADSSKFDIRARHCALPITRIDTLITDDRISEANETMLRNEGVEVVIAFTKHLTGAQTNAKTGVQE
nr:hypothetical protein [Marinicella sp. W31]MDC2880249.1 hypothetical protein [Marinicella sp. W31]